MLIIRFHDHDAFTIKDVDEVSVSLGLVNLVFFFNNLISVHKLKNISDQNEDGSTGR